MPGRPAPSLVQVHSREHRVALPQRSMCALPRAREPFGDRPLPSPAPRQAEVEAAQRDRSVQADQAARLREEVGLLRRQYDDAKRNYDSEVVRHGDALKRYAGACGQAAGKGPGGRPRGCPPRAAGALLPCVAREDEEALCAHAPLAGARAPSNPALLRGPPSLLRAAMETSFTALQQRLNEAVLELDAARVAKTQVGRPGGLALVPPALCSRRPRLGLRNWAAHHGARDACHLLMAIVRPSPTLRAAGRGRLGGGPRRAGAARHRVRAPRPGPGRAARRAAAAAGEGGGRDAGRGCAANRRPVGARPAACQHHLAG